MVLMLSRIAITGKWLLLYLSLSLPFVGVGQVFGGPTGAALGFLLGAVAVFALSMLAEQIVLNAHRTLGEAPPGLMRTYLHVAEKAHARRPPEIYVFPDPSPLALVARNPGSEGMILLSQGAVSAFNEVDLRDLLTGCLERMRSPRVPLATVSGVLALALVRFVPTDWLELFMRADEEGGRTPILASHRDSSLAVTAALRLVLFLPLIRYFLYLGRGDRQTPEQWIGFAARCGARHWFRIRHPALFHLYLMG
jgi:heat shock protein HtpX